MHTPSKRFLTNIKHQLEQITSAAKSSPTKASKQCIKSIKRMANVVDDSELKSYDKKDIKRHLKELQKSLSPQKTRRSSSKHKSEKTLKSTSRKKAESYNTASTIERQRNAYEFKQLQLKNKMLQQQVRAYKKKVKQARNQMLKQVQNDSFTEDKMLQSQLQQTKKQLKQAKNEIRHLNHQLQQKQQRIDQLEHINSTLKKKLILKQQSLNKRRLDQDNQHNQVQQLQKQVQRLKVEKELFDTKKNTLLSSNQKLKDIVRRYKSYL